MVGPCNIIVSSISRTYLLEPPGFLTMPLSVQTRKSKDVKTKKMRPCRSLLSSISRFQRSHRSAQQHGRQLRVSLKNTPA